ncbi:MAG TPA: alpha/beta hydrolase [Ktedonobacteraceae bacterium]|nr:alpha/beta hydrolase [Ktedonobacteraceae bacterium]
MPFATMPHSNMTLYYDYFSSGIPESASFPTMLLLHGFAGTPESDFEAQIPLLRSRYNILAPHLYGYGRSSQRSNYVTSYYREDAANMVELLDALHIARVNVLGFSDGATVGLLMAALYPQRVESLAVLGAQPTINQRDVSAIRHWLLEKPLSEEWQAQLAQLHGDPYWRSLPAMYVKGQEELVAAGGIIITDQELAAITCPALIMHGVRDRIVSVEYAHTLHTRIAGSRLLLFDAGHPAHIRCEKEYNAAIMEFFA